MYDTVLVPTDGSDHSLRAAEHALSIAGLFDGSVHALSVVDVQAAAGPFDAGGVDETFVDRLETDAQAAAEQVATLTDDAVTTAVVRGDPSEAILAHADEVDADLIAMGTRGRTGVSRYVAGSVTERVLRLAEMPVLTATADAAGPGDDTDYDDLLVPTDGSDAAAAAVGPALAVAERADARVHVVAVVGDSAPEPVTEAATSAAREATDDVATRARERGLTATTAVRHGSPAATLLAYADESGIDLIVMGTRGRTGLSRHLLGSTTERTVRHSPVPVLAVDAGDDEP